MNCGKCGAAAQVADVGSASGRKTWRCPACGVIWREKNAAAAALGALGGAGRAEALSSAELSAQGTAAASARWTKEKGQALVNGARGILSGKAFKKDA